MSYCEHCEGQRYDRARVLRELRQVRRQLRAANHTSAEDAIDLALAAVRRLDIPHLEIVEVGDETVH